MNEKWQRLFYKLRYFGLVLAWLGDALRNIPVYENPYSKTSNDTETDAEVVTEGIPESADGQDNNGTSTFGDGESQVSSVSEQQ